jgi:hypothetical protein
MIDAERAELGGQLRALCGSGSRAKCPAKDKLSSTSRMYFMCSLSGFQDERSLV